MAPIQKVALVTGGASGISLCLVKVLLAKGYHVSVLDLQVGSLRELIAKPNSQRKSRIIFLQCDISDWAALDRCFEATLNEFSRLDVVVNGAGVYEPDWSSFWKNTETTGYKTLDINLAASIRITRLAIKTFMGRQESSEGVVMNISSIAGQRTSFYCPLYTATKWAISGFTRAMATLDREMGIKVMAVAPGIVRTPLWTASPKGSMLSDEDVWVEPEEVAEAMMDMIEGKNGYRGGDVLEVLANSRRMVPLAEPMPSGPGATVSNSKEQVRSLLEELHLDRATLLKQSRI